jgi:hypothetical protein
MCDFKNLKKVFLGKCISYHLSLGDFSVLFHAYLFTYLGLTQKCRADWTYIAKLDLLNLNYEDRKGFP